MKKPLRVASAASGAALVTALACGLVSCTGSSGGSAAPAATTTLKPPAGLSVVPLEPRAQAKLASPPLAAPDAGTAYAETRTVAAITVPGVGFPLIERVLEGLGKVHLQDHLDGVPYGVWMRLDEEEGWRQWVVSAQPGPDPAADPGQNLQVAVWEVDPEETELKILVQFTAAPEFGLDGALLEAGAWRMVVENGAGEVLCNATADLLPSGASHLVWFEKQPDAPDAFGRRGEAVFDPDSGLGKEEALDPALGTVKTRVWAYNTAQVELKSDGAGARFLDRALQVPADTRYGVFDAASGTPAGAAWSFGFPVRFTEAGEPLYGEYHVDGGREVLWSKAGTPPPDGTLVVRRDLTGSIGPYRTVTVPGTLEVLTPRSGDLSELVGEPLELRDDFELSLTTTDGIHWLEDGEAYANLGYLGEDKLRHRVILGPTAAGEYKVPLVYQAEGDAPGFYEVKEYALVDGRLVPRTLASTPFVPPGSQSIRVRGWGRAYLTCDGSDFFLLKADGIDAHGEPDLDPAAAEPFTLALNHPYPFNEDDLTVTVERTGAGISVLHEDPTVIDPANVADYLGATDILREDGYLPLVSSTYRFDQDVSHPTWFTPVIGEAGLIDLFLGLGEGVDPVGTSLDRSARLELVDPLGLKDPVAFTWTVPRAQTYLYTGSGPDRVYELPQPLAFDPVTVSAGGLAQAVPLTYDFAIHNVGNLRRELALNKGRMTAALAGHAQVLPEGLALTAAGRAFRTRTTRQRVVLEEAAAPDRTLDNLLALALGMDLDSSVPAPEGTGLGPAPAADLLYSDDNKLQ